MTYLEEAQVRAKRRRSRWNLLLIPAIVLPLGILSWGFVQVLQWLHQLRFPSQHLADAAGLGPVLTTVGSFLAAIPLALLVGNGLVWRIGPARRVLEQEASAVPQTDFASAQRQLIRVALIVIPLTLGVAVVGALLSWGG